jgi:antitoxin (DNA-binding transcriptional repressor) of toxin-antitoxin stability system
VKIRSATEVARNFSRALDEIERDRDEIVVVRNHRRIARIVPEPPEQTALEVLGDLYRKLDDDTADALSKAVAKGRQSRTATLDSLRNPWVS